MSAGKSKDSGETRISASSPGQTGEARAVLAIPDREAEDGEGDDSLVRKTLAGNSGAFDVLVLRYQDRVYNILLGICPSAQEAEDLAQEAFMKAYRGLSSFRQGSKLYTWLFRIAVNTGLSGRRQTTRRKAHEGARLDSGSDDENERAIEQVPAREENDPAGAMDREATIRRVREGLEQIEPDYRTILVLRDMDGLDYDRIAETLSISRAAVKSRLHRARLEMARILKDLRQ